MWTHTTKDGKVEDRIHKKTASELKNDETKEVLSFFLFFLIIKLLLLLIITY